MGWPAVLFGRISWVNPTAGLLCLFHRTLATGAAHANVSAARNSKSMAVNNKPAFFPQPTMTSELT